MISNETRSQCVALYKSGRHTIKEIMALTGIKSEQTIYRILAEKKVKKRASRPTKMRVCISLDEEASMVIEQENPANLSEFVCRAIVAYGKSLSRKKNENGLLPNR